MYKKEEIMKETIQYKAKNNHGEISLCICKMKENINPQDIGKNFGKEEIRIYEKLTSAKRKKEMFYGRLMAKTAIMEMQKHRRIPFNKIDVTRGILNYPIVKGIMNKYSVSISHCKNYAAAIAFPEELLLGLDIEFQDGSKVKDLALCISDGEEILKPITMTSDMFQYVVWTCKEALAKSIRLGLTMNYEILKLSSLNKEDTWYESTFVNFPGLKGYTKRIQDYIYTIVYPEELEILKLPGRY